MTVSTTEYAWKTTYYKFKGVYFVYGPSSIDDLTIEILDDGDGKVFAMCDDDGILYYIGRYIGPKEHEDAPLKEYGLPNDGCTNIVYEDGTQYFA